jgi:argininosuccinate synthase
MGARDQPHPKIQRACLQRFLGPARARSASGAGTETQRDVTGLARLKLYKGNIVVAGRKSPNDLYDPEIATMQRDASQYNQPMLPDLFE